LLKAWFIVGSYTKCVFNRHDALIIERSKQEEEEEEEEEEAFQISVKTNVVLSVISPFVFCYFN